MAEQRLESEVDEAVLRTVTYADVFDCAPSARDVHRYLVGVAAPAAATGAALARLVPDRLSERSGLYTLRGREGLVATRRAREAAAARLWPQAVRYGRVLAQLPFVRMVAVTGSLTRDNSDARSDIDYLLVTDPGRVWVARALTGAVRRVVRRRGIRLCINYILSVDALALADRNLFTAHELAQMVPVAGDDVYERLRAQNTWAREFLPNADGAPRPIDSPRVRRPAVARPAEARLPGRIVRWVERVERGRFERKLPLRTPHAPEVVYSADCFKDHVDSWGERVLAAYAERLAARGAEA